MLNFEWDNRKAENNELKHKISFHEASTVFNDPYSLFSDDPDHSQMEERYIAIGHSYRNRILFVSYTEREDKIRIISSRLATKKEKKSYEKKR